MDKNVMDIVEKALAGESISDAEAISLFEFDTFSAEAYHVAYGANVLARKASKGLAVVYAQIGVDTLPCAKDCGWCSFSTWLESNRHVTDLESRIVDTEQIVEYAKVFDEAGAHLISLMATATLPFSRYLDMVRAVRENISDELPLFANVDDFSLEQAYELKDAGIQGVYHANRLGEGVHTKISPETRLNSMKNAQESGLLIMNAVEPVHQHSDPSEIVAKMREAASFDPICSGIGTLTPIPGSPMGEVQTASRARTFYYNCIYRLLVGDKKIPFGVGAKNAVWTDAGTNPRGRDLSTDPDFLRRDVQRIAKEHRRQEWIVPDKASVEIYC